MMFTNFIRSIFLHLVLLGFISIRVESTPCLFNCNINIHKGSSNLTVLDQTEIIDALKQVDLKGVRGPTGQTGETGMPLSCLLIKIFINL